MANKRQQRKMDKKAYNFIVKNKNTNLGYILPTPSEYKKMTRVQKNFYNEKISQLQSKNELKSAHAIGGILQHGSRINPDEHGLTPQHSERVRNVRDLAGKLTEFIVPIAERDGFKEQHKYLYNSSSFNRRDYRTRMGEAFNELVEDETKKEYEDRMGKDHTQHALDTSNEYITQELRNLDCYEAENQKGTIVYDPNAEPTSGHGSGKLAYFTYDNVNDVKDMLAQQAFAKTEDLMLRAGKSEKWGDKGALDLFG